MVHRRYPWRRYLLANWRDVRVLLRQFYVPLQLFVVSVLLGGLIFDLLYTRAEVQDLTYAESACAIFSMIFFGESVPFPGEWYLQIFFFVMPIIGLGLIVQGFISFGVMLFNKSAREGEWQVAIASTYRAHVIVAGIGRLGIRVARGFKIPTAFSTSALAAPAFARAAVRSDVSHALYVGDQPCFCADWPAGVRTGARTGFLHDPPQPVWTDRSASRSRD